MPTTHEEQHAIQLTAALSVEDHVTEFYVVSRSDGHDFTLSLDADVAEQLARFILERLGRRRGGSGEDLGRHTKP